jgi:hypothetical protein
LPEVERNVSPGKVSKLLSLQPAFVLNMMETKEVAKNLSVPYNLRWLLHCGNFQAGEEMWPSGACRDGTLPFSSFLV